jgi:(E)-4-hydroxy-3-methylbut-2-enyl-diphosphate synthase
MMNRWGDTPRGMVESCLEFLQVCEENDFHNVVISMKASNTLAMVHAVRLLVSEMAKRDMHYPLHLGVTEAGDGEDGRIKSSVGIGALLHDGIGDTVRVSLSEEPEAEIPVAKKLATYIIEKQGHDRIVSTVNSDYNFFEYDRRQTSEVLNIGGENVPVVFMNKDGEFATLPDFLLRDNKVYAQDGSIYNVFDTTQLDELKSDNLNAKFLKLSYPELNDKIIDLLKASSDIVVLLSSNHKNQVGEMRAFFHTLLNKGIKTPVVLCRNYTADDLETYQIQAAADLGVMFLDGFGDGIFLEYTNALAPNKIRTEQLNAIAFGILQASRVRVSKTEYISCPGCGRTLFQLQTVIAKVKAATSHLKGLKIAVMGCIVNGPGEMADADYGYVGAGRGKVSLYKKKECLERNIDENEAVAKLIDLIKANGDWHD